MLTNNGFAKDQLSKIFKHKIVIIFLSISLTMCFGCSKEPSHPDGSFEYPQHMIWLRNKKNNFQLHTLIRGPGFESESNYSGQTKTVPYHAAPRSSLARGYLLLS